MRGQYIDLDGGEGGEDEADAPQQQQQQQLMQQQLLGEEKDLGMEICVLGWFWFSWFINISFWML
jgi:hypothetical protein